MTRFLHVLPSFALMALLAAPVVAAPTAAVDETSVDMSVSDSPDMPLADPTTDDESLLAFDPQQDSFGVMKDFQGLTEKGELVELRKAFSGAYGTGLYFHPATLDYYIATFHGNEYWRTVKARSEKKALEAFDALSRQTSMLSEAEATRVKLLASRNFAQKQVALYAEKSRAYQLDQARQRELVRRDLERQQKIREEIVSIDTERRQVRAELEKLRMMVRALEAQSNDLKLMVPMPIEEASTVSAVKAMAPIKPIPPAPVLYRKHRRR